MTAALDKLLATLGNDESVEGLTATLLALDELMEDPKELTYENSVAQTTILRRLQAEAFRVSAEELGADDEILDDQA